MAPRIVLPADAGLILSGEASSSSSTMVLPADAGLIPQVEAGWNHDREGITRGRGFDSPNLIYPGQRLISITRGRGFDSS